MAASLSSLVHLEEQLERCSLFEGLSAQQRLRVAALITEQRVEPGSILVREGEPASELVLIFDGEVEVVKRAAGGSTEHRLATLRGGTTLGEMTLVDRAPRSASARIVTAGWVGILSMDRLAELTTTDPQIERQLLRNLANELARRLRFTNVTTAAALEQQLELERTRAMMGRVVIFLTFMMVTYTFLLKLAVEVLPPDIGPSVITIPITFAYAAALYSFMRHSGLPFACFGLTLENVWPVMQQALGWTVATCALATIFKLALIWWSPAFADQRLFNVSGVLDPRTTWTDLRTSLVLAIFYAAVAPLQEFIVRAGLQTALQRCLVGTSVTARAIVISNALFASAHLHLSVSFAIVSFFPGLLWGALFARQRNLVGVSVSHILCGWFGFLVLGFEPWY